MAVLTGLACGALGSDRAHASAHPEAASQGEAGTRLLAQPAVHGEHVAFVYAGDLWVSRIDGTQVRRLTTHSGIETRPRFSPDGKTIAFSAQYDGNLDVYLVPVEGGVPRRLTWHPSADLVQDFAPDGSQVFFTSGRAVYTNRFLKLYSISVDGAFPSEVPLPNAFKAAVSPDGKRIAYVPLREAFNQWKNYRGGTASRIWIYDRADHSVEQVPQPEGRCNDTDPMWIGARLFFRSDRNGEFNLFAWEPGSTGEPTQLTSHEDFPIVNASAGPERIAYEQAGWLHLYDPSQGVASKLAISVGADRIETRPRYVEGKDYVRSASLSPSGVRAVVGVRGEVVTLPADKGDPRYLTRTPDVHERYPVWSPNGKWIAYFADPEGEYELFVAPANGKGDVRRFTLGGAGFYDDPKWSPDSKKISFSDNSWSLYWLELESGEVVKVAQEAVYGPIKTLHHSWSLDSEWLAYTANTPMGFQRVQVYELSTDRSQALTDGLSAVSEPVFDASGKYIYFSASTDAGPVNTWFAQSNADMESSNALYLAVLAADEPSPLAKESDEEEVEEEEEDSADEAAESEDSDDSAEAAEDDSEAEADDAVRVVIDFEGLDQRVLALPLGVASYSGLAAGEAGRLYYLKSEPGNAGAASLASFDLEEREETVLTEGVQGFALSANGEKVLYVQGGGYWVAGSQGKIDKGQALAIDAIELKIEPLREWAQIFDEAWRINRDYFYDPGMHGADWPAMREKYAVFLPHLATRGDLNRVIRWMCSELGVGHHNVGGGDTLQEADSIAGGLLGADYEVADGRYRFAKVFGGLNWNPELRAPLTEPGVSVRPGEYLLAVNGEALVPPDNLYARFENTAGKQVELEVGPNADGSDSRTVSVVPVASEAALRNRDWVEGNLRRVTEATDGRVAYVYVPNTAGLGHTYFKRYFFPQADREAIIIDERHNGGGQVADYYIDILRRPHIADWAMRYGADLETPQGAIQGPKVMLIDETAGSGGDLLPWMFRKFELGPLIGRPTWGGLVGILGFPVLMDGGRVSAPNIGIWTEDGFVVENVGVPPDIEVEQYPADVLGGRDPQLERAIEVILEELERNPPVKRERPPFPIRVRR